MQIRNKRLLIDNFLAIIVLLSSFSACAPGQVTATRGIPSSTPGPINTAVPTDTQTSDATIALPEITLKPGDMYFSVNGRQSFLFSRNLAGYEPSQYIQLIDLMKGGGSQLVRIQLDSIGTGITSRGEIDEAWVENWESVFDKAAESGINVLPVFSGWFDWNNGTPDYGYSTWEANAFNVARGGPTANPGELFQPDSATQKLWLHWMKTLVERWSERESIAAWEIFSEVNIATGATELNGVAFIEQAADIIRNADPRHPANHSLSGRCGGMAQLL